MSRSIGNTTQQCAPAYRGRLVAAVALTAIVVLASQTGCSVCYNFRRTLFQEPAEYPPKLDHARSLKVYRQWADEAWAVERGSCPEMAGSEEYALGFRDGFVDYVYAGGSGEPPPIPPRKFWNVAWRNPPGRADALQWSAGYRHGASAARNGGYRENGVVPSVYAWMGPGPWNDVDGQLPAGEALSAPAEPLPQPNGSMQEEQLDSPTESVEIPPAPTLPESDESAAPMPGIDESAPPMPESDAPESTTPETDASEFTTPESDELTPEAPAEFEPLPSEADDAVPFDVLPGQTIPFEDQTTDPIVDPTAIDPTAINPTSFEASATDRPGAPRSTSAVQRFRRAVNTVRLNEASPVP
jgi:hypothetical protein